MKRGVDFAMPCVISRVMRIAGLYPQFQWIMIPIEMVIGYIPFCKVNHPISLKWFQPSQSQPSLFRQSQAQSQPSLCFHVFRVAVFLRISVDPNGSVFRTGNVGKISRAA